MEVIEESTFLCLITKVDSSKSKSDKVSTITNDELIKFYDKLQDALKILKKYSTIKKFLCLEILVI